MFSRSISDVTGIFFIGGISFNNSILIYKTAGGWVCIYVFTIYMWHPVCGVPGPRLAGSSRVRRS